MVRLFGAVFDFVFFFAAFFAITHPHTHSTVLEVPNCYLKFARGPTPFAFTEQGVAMLSSVLRSSRAVQVNIAIMRTFAQLRRLIDSNSQLARKIRALEKKYDERFAVVFAAIKELIAPPVPPRKQIGFHP